MCPHSSFSKCFYFILDPKKPHFYDQQKAKANLSYILLCLQFSTFFGREGIVLGTGEKFYWIFYIAVRNAVISSPLEDFNEYFKWH